MNYSQQSDKLVKRAEKKAKRIKRVADNAQMASISRQDDLGGPNKPAKAPRLISKPKERKRLIKALDTEFSLLIRKLCPMCPFCGKNTEHCFHFVTRAKYSVRWDERNAVGSCAGCNLRYEYDPHFAVTWYINRCGLPAYEQLIRDGNQIAKLENSDLQTKLDNIRLRRQEHEQGK